MEGQGGGAPAKTKVLCVDDEPSTLEVMKAYLERTPDLDVECVESAESALKRISGDNLDIVVSDYQMPDMDGLDLLKALRHSGEDIPFIMFTGRGREEVAMEALNNGANFYLQKTGHPRAVFAELTSMITQSVAARRAQKNLRRTSQTLAAVVSHSPVPIYAFDREGIVTLWNDAAERVYGWTAEEIVGRKLPTLLPGEQSEFEQILETAKGGNTVSGIPVTRVRKDGSLVKIMKSAAPLRDDEGEITGIIVVAIDITERNRLEESLRRLTHMYAFLSMANHAIVQAKSRKDLLTYIAGAAVTHGGFRLAWIGSSKDGADSIEPMAMWTSEECDQEKLKSAFGEATGAMQLAAEAYEDDDLVVVNDISGADWESLSSWLGIRSAAAVPIRDKEDGKVVLMVCSSEPGYFMDKEREFLKEISIDVSLALDGATEV